jgi:hypothetical protein
MCWYSTPTIENCLIANNTGVEGGGICVYNAGPDKVAVRNCIILANEGEYGGGVEGCGLVLYGCTIVANSEGGISSRGDTRVYNSVIWGNTPSQIVHGSPYIEFSDVQGGWPGTGNIDADPLFVDQGTGDFRLQASSPCIDAGSQSYQPLTLETDFDGRMRVWDGNGNGQAVIDMGAYEHGSFRYGDLNCDGAVDFDDIDPFILALSDPAGYQAAYPGCARLLADDDGDGDVDFDDINPFVAKISGNVRDPG